jgi:hypothetical protein
MDFIFVGKVSNSTHHHILISKYQLTKIWMQFKSHITKSRKQLQRESKFIQSITQLDYRNEILVYFSSKLGYILIEHWSKSVANYFTKKFHICCSCSNSKILS